MRILFYCPIVREHVGAFKEIYRMVDVLNELGYPAFVVHSKTHREEWFENNTAIISLTGKRLSEFITNSDILVLQRINAGLVYNTRAKSVVIFNQAPYFTFKDYGYEIKSSFPYFHPKVCAVITVSEDAVDYFRMLQLKVPVNYLHHAVDQNLFYLPKYKKDNLIVFMIRRNIEDIEQVIQILRLRKGINNISRYRLLVLDEVSHRQVAENLLKAKFFLSFGYQEGFGLPIAEAMMSGCVVIGYGGLGGNELFHTKHAFQVPDGDIKTFVKLVEAALLLDQKRPDEIWRMGIKAHNFIKKKYSEVRYRLDTEFIWENIFRNLC